MSRPDPEPLLVFGNAVANVLGEKGFVWAGKSRKLGCERSLVSPRGARGGWGMGVHEARAF